MIDRELTDIAEADLVNLKLNSVREGKQIEYKGELNLTSPEQMRKFLSGIASFANASGGDIVYGMEAKDGQPVALKALRNFNPDKDVLRLRDLINAHIEPRVFAADFKSVALATGGYVLVIRVRKTWAGAHMVTFSNDNRFYTRDHGGRRLMDVSEVSSAFTQADSLAERVKRFRLERLANISAGETPCPLSGTAFIIVHLVPFRAFDPAFRANLDAFWKQTELLRPLAARGWCASYDFDGVFASDGSRCEAANGYVHAFKNSVIEAVDTALLRPGSHGTSIPSIDWERELLTAMPQWFRALRAFGAEPPALLLFSLLGVRGYDMGVGSDERRRDARPIGRDQLYVPPAFIESFDIEADGRTTPYNVFDLMRPLFDSVWQACGYPRSLNFYENGDWGAQR